MKNSIHILNGDSTYHLFKQSQIMGKTVVWREAFSDGQLIGDINSDSFWNHRMHELHRLYGVSIDDYTDKTINEVQKIHHAHYDELTLWFEHDFYCQINLIACIAYLVKSEVYKSTPIYLICVGEDQINGRNATLSDYTPKQYEQLYKHRIELNSLILDEMASLFSLLCSDDPNDFYQQCQSNDFLPFLDQTRECFKHLFPENSQVLSIFDKHCLTLADNASTIEEAASKIMQYFHRYGFGDSQVYSKLKRLNRNFISYTPLHVKKKDFKHIDTDYIGNFDRSQYYFDTSVEKFFLKQS